MRISKLSLPVTLLFLALPLAAAASEAVTFRSPDDALRQGIAAFNGGYYELAMPALDAATTSFPVLGRYYLARIYADNEGAYTDHPKAFATFKKLAEELQDTDPDDDELAPIAAKALAAMSSYLRDGIAEANLKADVPAADQALQRAALTFNNEDAQFELAKVLLRGEGPKISLSDGDGEESKIENGRHWLSRLSRNGHAGAQAFLADLLWRGKFVPKDQASALNLIDVAVGNAPPHERVWIEDIYQNIFCNAGEGVRRQATGRVAEWHDRYGRQQERRAEKITGLEDLAAEPVRTCSNGEPVRPMQTQATAKPAAVMGADDDQRPQIRGSRANPNGDGYRDIGTGFAPDNN